MKQRKWEAQVEMRAIEEVKREEEMEGRGGKSEMVSESGR